MENDSTNHLQGIQPNYVLFLAMKRGPIQLWQQVYFNVFIKDFPYLCVPSSLCLNFLVNTLQI